MPNGRQRQPMAATARESVLILALALLLMMGAACVSSPPATPDAGLPTAATVEQELRMSEQDVQCWVSEVAGAHSPDVRSVGVNVLPENRQYVDLRAQVYLGDVLMDVRLLMKHSLSVNQGQVVLDLIGVQRLGSYTFSDERLTQNLGFLPGDLAEEPSGGFLSALIGESVEATGLVTNHAGITVTVRTPKGPDTRSTDAGRPVVGRFRGGTRQIPHIEHDFATETQCQGQLA